MTEPLLIIHRSAHEIGGNCIEIALGSDRLLLDAGRPLDADPAMPAADLLPASLDRSRPVRAVLISHPHQDHYGLVGALPPDWPVWAGAGAGVLMRLTAEMAGAPSRPVRPFTAGEPLHFGPFTVTPFGTDHSAFDSHMLLIDVAGRRILYSGDFRLHGYGRGGAVFRAPPGGVDILIMEGTNLKAGAGAAPAAEPPLEADLVGAFRDLFAATHGRVFVAWSSQNIDRNRSLLSACRASGRTLLVDLFTAEVLLALRPLAPVPVPGDPGLRVVVTKRLARRYTAIGKQAFVASFAQNRTGMSARCLEKTPGRWVAMLRATMIDDYAGQGVTPTADDAWCFSQWRGYLNDKPWQPVHAWFSGAGTPRHAIHTSGHAGVAGLARLVEIVAPKRLVPIHGEGWGGAQPQFPRLVRLNDGQPTTLHEILSHAVA